jgi:hexosaminidase
MKLSFALLFTLLFTSARSMEVSVPHIIPVPQKIEATKTPFKITSGTKIVLGAQSSRLEFIAQCINEELADLKGPALKVAEAQSLRKLPSDFIFLGTGSSDYAKTLLRERKGELTPQMKEEGYFLDVRPDGIAIIAESEKGVFYGAMSLLQILRRDKRSLYAEGVTITDYPSLRVRGISDDISRGQVSTLENFKKIIRFCARYKLNVYSPYIEDMFQFSGHPEIGKNRGALTHDECRELDAYAKQYFVELIPVFETLGHWENILIQPDYITYAEFPGAHTVNVSDERVYALLDEMIGELASCFSSEYFNMAADESWDVGLGVNRERVAKSDLATVHAEHYKRVVAILKKYHKKPIMYGDVILNNPTILEKIPKDITIVDWHYGAELSYPSPQVFSKAGFPFIVSPAVWNFTTAFPAYVNTFVNIQNLNRDGMENGSIGLLTSTWGDYGSEDLREFNYYGYAWTSECAWNPPQARAVDFNKAFFADYYGTKGREMQTVYDYLSMPSNLYNFHELWRSPMLPLRQSQSWDSMMPVALRVQCINATMPEVLSLLDDAKQSVTRNEDQLQRLAFVAKLNLWFAQKITSQEKIKRIQRSVAEGADKQAAASEITALAADVMNTLAALKKEYRRLWLLTNKPEGLELLEKRYDRQTQYWQEIVDRVKQGVFAYDPVLESQFIYHPNANPMMREMPQVRSAAFRKTFTVPKGLRSAKLQLIGDTYAKAAVNGTAIGEVYARRSLSLTEEHQRVKVFDILPLLTDSVNVVTVDVQNYAPTGSAGINIYCEFETKDGAVRQLVTDSTWRVSEKPEAGWTSASFNDAAWTSAAAKTYGWTIVRPNFATGRASWIER